MSQYPQFPVVNVPNYDDVELAGYGIWDNGWNLLHPFHPPELPDAEVPANIPAQEVDVAELIQLGDQPIPNIPPEVANVHPPPMVNLGQMIQPLPHYEDSDNGRVVRDHLRLMLGTAFIDVIAMKFATRSCAYLIKFLKTNVMHFDRDYPGILKRSITRCFAENNIIQVPSFTSSHASAPEPCIIIIIRKAGCNGHELDFWVSAASKPNKQHALINIPNKCKKLYRINKSEGYVEYSVIGALLKGFIRL